MIKCVFTWIVSVPCLLTLSSVYQVLWKNLIFFEYIKLYKMTQYVKSAKTSVIRLVWLQTITKQ